MKSYLQHFIPLVLFSTTTVSVAVPIDSIVAKHTSPVAPRGGIMMVRLLSEEVGTNWPASIPVTFSDNSMTEGIVGWIESKPATSSWTDDRLIIRPILSADTTANIHPKDETTGPVLLVQLPEDCDGEIYFGAESVVPNWMDLPTSLPPLNLTDPRTDLFLKIGVSDHLPPIGALHYWRWVLLASRLGVVPPKVPMQNQVETLAAQHGEHLWRIALNNLSIASRGVAADCRDLLTDTTVDGDHQFACWVENQETLEELLEVLLNTSLTSKQLVQRSLRWIDRQSRSLFWFENIFGPTVTLKFANCNPEPAICLLAWEGVDEIPLPLEVHANQTGQITLERPQVIDLSVFGPVVTTPIQKLTLAMPSGSTVFPVEGGIVDARPPRIQLPALSPTWTLLSLGHGYARQVLPNQQTSVEVRFILGRWEIFIRCLGNDKSTAIAGTGVPIGEEAITLFFPLFKDPVVIRPTTTSHPNITVYTHAENSSWNVRVVLPDSLIQNEELAFSIARTHGGSKNVETSPLPSVPWHIKPEPIIINTGMWNTIDNIPITPDPE